MATLTKTFTENRYSSNRSTWTITVSKPQDIVADSEYISDFNADIKAKYVGSNKGQGRALVRLREYGLYPDSTETIALGMINKANTSGNDQVSWASNTEKTLVDSKVGASPATRFRTSYCFNSNNPTQRTIDIIAFVDYLNLMSTDTSAVHYNDYSFSAIQHSEQIRLGQLFKITLNAPPEVVLGTPSYQSPQYTNIGEYSVDVETATAKYGGNISSIKLSIGAQSVTEEFSTPSTSVEDVTMSLVPAIAGTFTPTITITDSRGQQTIQELTQITVNQYLAPSVSFDVFRSNAAGVKDDEGHNGLITAVLSCTKAVANLTQPAVTVKDQQGNTVSNTVTWYSNYSNSTGVSFEIQDWSSIDSGATVYGLIDCNFSQTGHFSEASSYPISIVESDSRGTQSTAVTQTLSTAFYTIDFQAGGREITFGGPANDDITDYNGKDYSDKGLFKCNMGTAFTDMTDGEVDDFVDGLNISGIGDMPVVVGVNFGITITDKTSGVKTASFQVVVPAGYTIVQHCRPVSLHISGDSLVTVTDRNDIAISGDVVSFQYYLNNPNNRTSNMTLNGTILCCRSF